MSSSCIQSSLRFKPSPSPSLSNGFFEHRDISATTSVNAYNCQSPFSTPQDRDFQSTSHHQPPRQRCNDLSPPRRSSFSTWPSNSTARHNGPAHALDTQQQATQKKQPWRSPRNAHSRFISFEDRPAKDDKERTEIEVVTQPRSWRRGTGRRERTRCLLPVHADQGPNSSSRRSKTWESRQRTVASSNSLLHRQRLPPGKPHEVPQRSRSYPRYKSQTLRRMYLHPLHLP